MAATVVKRLVTEGRQNRLARAAFAGRYLLNTLTNLGEILAGGRVAGLDGIGTGSAAVIAGAGPSLNRNIDELRPLRDRAIVLAAGSAMRPLLAAGLEPDLLVALDPGDINARNLAGTSMGNGTWLVAEGSLPTSVFQEFRGRALTFRVGDNHPWPWLRSIGVDPGKLRAWGSVITASFDLALRMGCDPIVFVGADHSYTGGLPYCRNTTWEKDWREGAETQGRSLEEIWRLWREARPVIAARDVHGQLAESAGHLLAYRDWLVDASVSAAPVRVINATGAGILWGGRVELLALEDALAGRSRFGFPAASQVRRRTRFEDSVVDRAALIAAGVAAEPLPAAFDVWARDVPSFEPAQARAALLTVRRG